MGVQLEGRTVNVAWSPAELERRPRAVAIGTFDGVHLGHRAVIRAAVDAGLTSTVVTFHPHPRTAFGNRVALLSTLERRLELLAELGVEDVLVVEFTPELASVPPEDFARDYLAQVGAEIVVCGTGFRFGRERAGNCDLLRTLGFDAREVPLVEGISSTKIRQLAEAGEVEGAARLLGRPLEIDGTVVSGDHRGGTLGFPTANLSQAATGLIPADGVYAGFLVRPTLPERDPDHTLPAAISIGTNPTFAGTQRRVEAYVLDRTDLELYGERVVFEFIERLRPTEKFDSVQSLVVQMRDDVERCRARLSSTSDHDQERP